MPSKILVEQIAHTNETSAIDIDSSGNMVLQKDLKFGSQGTIKNSAGNAILQESGGNITLSNVRLPASGGISDSSGNAILTESGGVTSLSNSTLASTCDVRSADGGIPAGARMVFQQTTAPTGWTKDTTHDNKALRIVSGTVGTGGNVSFTSGLTSKNVSGNVSVSVSNKALNSTSYMPSHRHYITARFNKNNSDGNVANAYSGNNYTAKTQYTNYEGGNGSHNHGANASFSGTAIDMSIMYVDFIIAEKD